mmetsp:Transcript_3150/g.8699  ORF Transcript_3150/g.8699 Transcript_3150/m.8699 type:complete len:253 (-) Transcript_3150:1070-1828(-)
MVVSVQVAKSVVNFHAGRGDIRVAAAASAAAASHGRTKGASQSTSAAVFVSLQRNLDFPRGGICGVDLEGLISLGGDGSLFGPRIVHFVSVFVVSKLVLLLLLLLPLDLGLGVLFVRTLVEGLDSCLEGFPAALGSFFRVSTLLSNQGGRRRRSGQQGVTKAGIAVLLLVWIVQHHHYRLLVACGVFDRQWWRNRNGARKRVQVSVSYVELDLLGASIVVFFSVVVAGIVIIVWSGLHLVSNHRISIQSHDL